MKHLIAVVSFFCVLPSTSFAMVVTVPSTDIDALVKRSLAVLEKSPQSQVFIGIGGGPGSGKSSIAESVSNAVNAEHRKMSIVVPMDGYHIPRSKLEEMGKEGRVIGDLATGDNGSTTFQDLLSRRGAPWTFDSKALIRDLTMAKETGEASFPTYSREIRDPIPNAVTLTRNHKIVYCEGNYLLAFEDDEWKPLEKLWDEKWYICVPEKVAEERLVNRHLKTWNDAKIELWGEGRAGAMKKAQASDLRNFRWIQEKSASHADVIIVNYKKGM